MLIYMYIFMECNMFSDINMYKYIYTCKQVHTYVYTHAYSLPAEIVEPLPAFEAPKDAPPRAGAEEPGRGPRASGPESLWTPIDCRLKNVGPVCLLQRIICFKYTSKIYRLFNSPRGLALLPRRVIPLAIFRRTFSVPGVCNLMMFLPSCRPYLIPCSAFY